MKRQRRNPGALVTLGWAVGSAAVAATISYVVLKEFYVNRVIEECKASLGRQGNPAPIEDLRTRAKALL